MKTHILIILSILIIVNLYCCKKEPTTPTPDPFLPYEEIKVSFGLSGVVSEMTDSYSFCEEVNHIKQGMDFGGPSGFHYSSGFELKDLSQGLEIITEFHVFSSEPVTSTTLEIETIYTLCSEQPDKCFTTIEINYEGKRYRSRWFKDVPFTIEKEDINAHNQYDFLENYWEMECFGNWPVLPITFEYDGYIYTTLGESSIQDSLHVSNFKSSFLVMKNF